MYNFDITDKSQYLIFHQQAKLYLQFSGVREIFSHSFLSRLHFTVPLSVHHLCANPVWTAKEIITWVVWLIAVNWLWSVEKTIWWGADCRIGCHSANLWSTELVSWARTLWTLWGCGPEVPGVGCQWGDFHSADVWWSHGMGLTGAQGWRDPLSIWLGRVMGPQPATQILLQCNMGCSEVLDQTQTVQMVGRCLSGHALHRASHHPCSLFFSNPTHWLSLSRPFSSPQFIFFFFHSFSWSLSGMNRIASVWFSLNVSKGLWDFYSLHFTQWWLKYVSRWLTKRWLPDGLQTFTEVYGHTFSNIHDPHVLEDAARTAWKYGVGLCRAFQELSDGSSSNCEEE